jgi:hypothetical protein
MDGRLIFLHRPVRLNLRVCFSKADPPVGRGGWGTGNRAPRGHLVPEVCGGGAEKSAVGTNRSPVLKLTQVGEESILRRSRELRLRN